MKYRNYYVSAIAGLSLLLSATNGLAQTVTLNSIKDTTLLEGTPGINQGSSTTLTLQNNNANTARSIIEFDLSSLSANVTSSSLVSAKLQFNIASNDGNWEGGRAGRIRAYSATNAWLESEATWLCASNVDCGWSGGAYGAESVQFDITNNTFGSIQFDVSAHVASILAGEPNYGWLIKKDLEGSDGSIVFHSSESLSPPQLILTVDLPPGTDITGPTLEIIEPSQTFYLGSAPSEIIVNFYDGDDGVNTESLAVTIDGVSINCNVTSGSASCPLVSLDSGIHQVAVSIEDNVGNLAVMERVFFYYENIANAGVASKWLTGLGEPISSEGNDGDMYLDNITGDVYQKSDGSWAVETNIVGPEGKQGIQGGKGDKGDNGTNGTNGSKGDKGDNGTNGSKGDKGDNGTNGSKGDKGDNGDSILNSLGCTANQLVQFDGTNWMCVNNLQNNPLGGVTCAEGEILQYTSGTWVCAMPTLGDVDYNDPTYAGDYVFWQRSNGNILQVDGKSTVVKNVVDIVGPLHKHLILYGDGIVRYHGTQGTNYDAIPDGLTDVISITKRGDREVLALKSDGTVVAWGGAASVPADLSNVAQLEAGLDFKVVRYYDGTVWVWGGANRRGQKNVPPGLSGVVEIKAGLAFVVALKDDGTVVGWGDITMPEGLTDVVQLAAGNRHALALKSDGTIVGIGWWWGRNFEVEYSDVVAIGAGADLSVLLRENGKLVAAGATVGGSTASLDSSPDIVGRVRKIITAGGGIGILQEPDPFLM